MIKKSFALRVLAINFLLLALPLLIDSFVFFQNSYYEAIRAAKKELKEVSNLRTFSLIASEPVKQVLLSELGYVIDISGKMAAKDFDHLTHELVEIAQLWREYQIYVLELSQNGYYKIVASSSRDLVNTFFEAYHPLETVLKTGSGTFVRYLYSDEAQSYVSNLFVAQAIESKETGKPIGILMVSSKVESLLTSLLAPSHQLRNAKFAILNSDGIVFKSTDPHLMGQYFKPISDKRRRQIISSRQLGNLELPDVTLPVIQGKDPPFFEFIFDDQVQIAYQAFIPEMKLSLVGYSPKEEFFGSAVRHFLFIYVTYGLILLGGGAVTYWLSLWISRPLRQLIHVMGEVRQGNLGVRFQEAPWGFEINILGSMFNNTIDTLLLNIQRAEDERVKKETYQREVAICREVQRSLFSSPLPDIKASMAAGGYLPATDVGGDFYYFFSKATQSGENVLALSMADIDGRGISPCLYSLSARSLFRAFSTLYDDVGTVLSLTNDDFIRDVGDAGVSLDLFLGFYHPDSRILSYCSCGSTPGMVKRNDGQIEPLNLTGEALGLQESHQYKSETLQLYSGDTLILYTSGLLKAESSTQKHFSEMQLKDILQSKKWNTAQDMVDKVKAVVQEFTAGTPQEEEAIIVALKID